MKISRGIVLTCLLTLAALSCESAFQELNSLNDLKKVLSGKSVPLHSLTLLHWFANHVHIINNTVDHVTFDLSGDFGSQYYSNNDGLLPSPPEGQYYYSVGNILQTSGKACHIFKDFPEYVVFPKVLEPANTERNRDRIIFSAITLSSGYKDFGQIYLTQHFKEEDNQGSQYDPEHTFSITINLLEQLRLFSFDDNLRSLQELRSLFDEDISDNMLNDLIHIWGRNHAPLGLLYLIMVPERSNLVGVCRSKGRPATDLTIKFTSEWKNCEIQRMHFQVVTGDNATARVVWSNVPREKLESGVAVALFKNQIDHGESLQFMTIKSSAGSYNTSVPLKEGLQARLHQIECSLCSPTLKEEICRGREFTNPQAVPVTGYSKLQLFQRQDKACFRLYVKKGCNQWRSDYPEAWVGLYLTPEKLNTEYAMYGWVKDFAQGPDSGEYNTFEQCMPATVTPGLQARFMINGGYVEKARTPGWH